MLEDFKAEVLELGYTLEESKERIKIFDEDGEVIDTVSLTFSRVQEKYSEEILANRIESCLEYLRK